MIKFHRDFLLQVFTFNLFNVVVVVVAAVVAAAAVVVVVVHPGIQESMFCYVAVVELLLVVSKHCCTTKLYLLGVSTHLSNWEH